MNDTKRYAIWTGRFQPFHAGHLSTLKAICETHDFQVIIAIITSTKIPAKNSTSSKYFQHAETQHKKERNPLSLWERITMVRKVLDARNLSQKAFPIGIPRPDLYWDTIKCLCPNNRIMFCPERGEFENKKTEHWKKRGEIVRTVISPSAISSTMLKEVIKKGEDWKSLIPEEIHEYFIEIDGPLRFSLSE